MRRILFVIIAVLYSFSSVAQNKGYRFVVDATGAMGLSKLSNYNVGVSIINGYKFNNKLSLGLGVGFRYAETLYYYSHDTTSEDYESRDLKYLIPIFARVKINFLDSDNSPFIIGDIGYTLDVGQNPYKNLEKFFFEPIVGVDFKSKDITYFLGLGVNVQHHHYTHFFISNVAMSGDRQVSGVATTLALHFGVQF